MYEEIVVPTALFGSEGWVLENKVKNRMEVTEMSCLRSMGEVTRRDRVRNEEIRRRCGLQRSLSERGKAAVLRYLVWTCGKDGRREVSGKDLLSEGGG